MDDNGGPFKACVVSRKVAGRMRHVGMLEGDKIFASTSDVWACGGKEATFLCEDRSFSSSLWGPIKGKNFYYLCS